MKYLLDQEELDDLRNRAKQDAAKHQQVLQDLCTRVANHEPVKVHWRPDDPPKPWGCILTDRRNTYCDECPVKKLCPHPSKQWSK